MTTLSGGFYSRTWNRKQPPGPKSWPPTKTNRSTYSEDSRIHRCIKEAVFLAWLTECKQYGAEYYNED